MYRIGESRKSFSDFFFPHIGYFVGNLGKPLGKDLGKVCACNSHDYQRVRYEIRQTYAVCLILSFMRLVTFGIRQQV